MPLDYTTLDLLRQNHPAWRLLCAKHAPLVASFLQRVFIAPNVRILSQADLVEALEDELFALREQLGGEAFPGSAQNYLNEWADNDKGWLRKFYPTGTDEPHFDLTPATEKALAWLEGLTERSFVGTESRLLTLFDLLRQMSEGSQTDPELRIAELHKRRGDIDAEIARILAGDIPLLDDTALKDRFQQFLQLARELLTDFREVEQNFRTLDRRVRERIALWEGAKGTLLEQIMGERDAIVDSDQGKSFRAFWDFLMSQTRQEELSGLLQQVLVLPPEGIDTTATGVGGFSRRYGFQEKLLRVRFRILDSKYALLSINSDQDITLSQQAFARLNPPVKKVFITENEINFLAFPPVPDALVIFGAGYGFESLATADWLQDRDIHYWGDIDTHGFAILNQLRGIYPATRSFLMDRQTLLSHRPLWGDEAQPETRELLRLSREEAVLYDDLRQNRLGERLRLEQERIGFDWLVEALAGVC